MKERRHRALNSALSVNVGVAVARSLIVRALRRAGLQQVLAGSPCMIAFIIPEESFQYFAAAAPTLVQKTNRCRRIEVEVLEWRRKARPTRDNGIQGLLGGGSVFALATRVEDVPPAFRLIADAVLTPDRVDARALRAGFYKVYGSLPPVDALDSVADVPLPLLSVVVQQARRPTDALRRLEAVRDRCRAAGATSSHDHPAIEDLHGMGEAADWALRLAADIRDFRNGRISWANVDRGVLLSGPPGTGKTTFARALARTCGVPVFVHSLARWQACGHLSDLLKAMRNAFDEAKNDTPCILFVDELDSFGDRARLSGPNEQYSREVINAFLECLDGANSREGVVVVGATNLPKKIDPAILRPGRLDCHIRIPLPDSSAREGILRYHLRGELADIDLSEVARRLEGATGAQIERTIRSARRIARTARRSVSLEDISAFLPSRVRLTDAAYRRTCVHEAGHAVVGYLLQDHSLQSFCYARVDREISHQGGAAGLSTFRSDPASLRTLASCMAEITVLLAGHAAEQIVFGAPSVGSGGQEQSDLHRATLLAAELEASHGLGVDLIYLAPADSETLMNVVRTCTSIQRRVSTSLAKCLRRASDILTVYRHLLDDVTELLYREGMVQASSLSTLLLSERSHAEYRGTNASKASRAFPLPRAPHGL